MAMLFDGDRVLSTVATWLDLENAVAAYFEGTDWSYFTLKIGDPERGKFMILSSKTRNSHLFAVLLTVDGRTFYSPSHRIEEGLTGTYGHRVDDVFPDDRCVSVGRAMRVARTYLESGLADPDEEWRAFDGTGYCFPADSGFTPNRSRGLPS